jgi:drug/metabolite transporter (DMT)-like permease
VTLTAVVLVLLSAVTHAYWNYLLKRAGGSHTFVAISKAAEAVIYLPVFLAVLWAAPANALHGTGLYVAVGTAMTLISYATLATAYRHGDLSFTYPIARGGALLFLPAFGWLVFGERVGPLGWAAIAAILGGVVVMQLPRLAWGELGAFFSHASGPATFFALLMALVLATGTIWDKLSVTRVNLFVYFYGYTAGAGICYLAWILRRDGRPSVRAEWQRHKWAAMAVGVLNTLSYGLALFALRDGGSTYVVGLRQISIAVGVLLGARLLGEHVSTPRRLGVSLVLVGSLLMAFGR